LIVEKYFFIKDTRAYTLTLEKDLLNDWVIRRTWGARKRPYSQKRTEIFESLDNARIRLEALENYRIEKRGYEKL